MCMSTPKIPEVKPLQEIKQPDSVNLKDSARRNRSGAMSGGSLLTGPSGIAAAPTGKSTLLGQ